MPDSAEGTCQEVRPSVPQIHTLRVQAVLCPNTRCEVSHTQHYATKNKERGGARTEGRDRLHDVTMNFVTSASCFTSRAGSPSEARARGQNELSGGVRWATGQDMPDTLSFAKLR